MANSTPTSPVTGSNNPGRRRGTSVSSVASAVASATENILSRDLPPGFFAATAEATSKAPTLGEIRSSGLGDSEGGRSRSQTRTSRRQSRGSRDTGDRPSQEHNLNRRSTGLEAFPALSEEPTNVSSEDSTQRETKPLVEQEKILTPGQGAGEVESPQDGTQDVKHLGRDKKVYTSGYIPPPKLPWTTSTAIALKAFWKWFLTPFGFLVTIYGLNIVAWGGMLFLLLCNASPAMCWTSDGNGGKFFDCNDINSPRRKWIEVDSQILNALFCLTGFGLAPWRFRDLYYLLSFRLTSERKSGKSKNMIGLRKLAGHYRGWFRLPESDTLGATTEGQLEALENDMRIPLPVAKRPDDPLTGVRAVPTSLWKVDFFIWCQIWNTIFQCCLAGFMWGMNRFDRPSWSTGLFIALACIVAGVGGLASYIEGRRVKRVEGVLPSPAVQEALRQTEDVELGLQQTRTGHESIHVGDHDKDKAIA